MEMHKRQIIEALKLYHAGLLPIPILPDGQKRPAIRWGEYRKFENRPSVHRVTEWFQGEPRGIAVMGGLVSGGLEQLDFDNHDSEGDEFQRWCEAIPTNILKTLVIYKTPGNGFKVCWRSSSCSEDGHVILAYRQPTEASIELLCAEPLLVPGGSPLAHPSGKPYQYIQGDLVHLPRLSEDDRNMLINEAKKLSKFTPLAKEPRDYDGLPFGNNEWTASGDYNQRATWEEILEPHGWRMVRQPGDTIYWCRPGKYGRSVSASTNYQDSDLFYCWSSNTDFQTNKGYQKWAVFAVLNFTRNGTTDFSAAAKELARLGYGRANYDLTYFYSKLKGFYDNKPNNPTSIL
jgi:Bifunctional DNA primase/polymerase, N-terminal